MRPSGGGSRPFHPAQAPRRSMGAVRAAARPPAGWRRRARRPTVRPGRPRSPAAGKHGPPRPSADHADAFGAEAAHRGDEFGQGRRGRAHDGQRDGVARRRRPIAGRRLGPVLRRARRQAPTDHGGRVVAEPRHEDPRVGRVRFQPVVGAQGAPPGLESHPRTRAVVAEQEAAPADDGGPPVDERQSGAAGAGDHESAVGAAVSAEAGRDGVVGDPHRRETVERRRHVGRDGERRHAGETQAEAQASAGIGGKAPSLESGGDAAPDGRERAGEVEIHVGAAACGLGHEPTGGVAQSRPAGRASAVDPHEQGRGVRLRVRHRSVLLPLAWL